MKKIVYQQMTSSTFQTFCNLLLWLEIGDTFIGYEAPGKDGGIDGEYRGKYKKQLGKWRFQYKFHLTDRKTAVRSIKADLADEINKLQDEDHLIFLTNVALNPNERKDLLLKAKSLLAEIGKDKVWFELWDEGFLQRLALRYPLIQQWIDPDASGIFLLPYRKAFIKQLNAPAAALETLANTFISRSVELQSLQNFFHNPDSYLSIIKGEAGIGKTRLAIEFFKQIVDAKPGWRTLAINQYTLDINKLTKALNGAQNYMVLVDDAHNFLPAMLADIRRMGGQRGKYITKFVFTMRSLQSYDAVKLISPLDASISTIVLNTLSPEATKELFEKELAGTYLRHYIDELVLISRGRPILIVGILQAAATGKKITDIKADTGFNSYVLRYFDTFLNQFVQQTGLEPLKAKNLLKLCCLIEPFSYKDTQLVQKIAEQENIQEDFVEAFLLALCEAGLSSGTHKQAIRPDYYSDVYLQTNAKQDWVTKKLTQYKTLQSNILINIASIDEVENDKPERLDTLLNQSLQEYLGELKTVDSIEAVTERLELAASIAFQKPAIAIGVVQDFIGILNDTTHFLGAEQLQYKGNSYNLNSNLIAFSKRVIRDALFYSGYYEAAFQLLFNLHKYTVEKDLFKDTFSFTHPTFLQQYSIKLQQFFVDKCKQILPVADDEQALFLLGCLKELLELRLDTSKWNLIKRNNISIQAYYLPKHGLIEQLRLTIIEVLLNCYHRHPKVAVQFEALSLVLDIPREISANKSSPSHYESDAEIEKVLGFLEAEAGKLPVAFRKEVLQELYWYKKQRVNPKYHLRIGKLYESLQPQTLTQKIIQYLIILEQKYAGTDEKTKYQAVFKELLAQNEPEATADALEEVWSSSMSQFWYFSGSVERVCTYDAFYAKAVYLQLKKKNRAFVQYYGNLFLRTFRCDERLIVFFQEEVTDYLASGAEKDLKTVLEVYSIYAANRILLNTYDKEIIAAIFVRRTDGLGITMTSTFALYYKQDAEAALAYIKDFLEGCTQVSASQLYWQLIDEISHSRQLSLLLLKASVRFKVDHHIEDALTRIAKGSTPEVMFDYFLQRYERKVLLRNTSEGGYSLVPTGERNFFSEGSNDDYRLVLYRLAIEWYIQINGNWFEEFYAEQLLEYLRPDLEFTMPCAILYVQVAIREKNNYPVLFRLTESFKMFHAKTPLLIDTLGYLLRIAEKAYSGSKPFISEIIFISNQALTCVGCKHGTAGQPFESDIQLRELLIEEQPHYSKDLTMKALIHSVIEEVEEDIKRQCRDEEPVW